MVKKINLYAVGNDENFKFNYYIFDKTSEVHEFLNSIFVECFNLKWPLVKESQNENDETIEEIIDISKYFDFHETIERLKPFSNRQINIDYGNKIIFVKLHCSSLDRKKFNDILKKKCKMPKPTIKEIIELKKKK